VAVEGSAILGMYPIRHRTLACLMVRPGQAGSEVACCDRAPPASAARGVGHLNGSWAAPAGAIRRPAAPHWLPLGISGIGNVEEGTVCASDTGALHLGIIIIEMTMPESNHSIRNRYRSSSDIAQ
jgi:hypothetical protein